MGEKEVGPLGFLAILETQLGIAANTDSTTARIIQYQACLQTVDHDRRFYHRSFTVDQFNVASTLLQWRDNWYEAGWNGRFSGDVAVRLRDMADVEELAREKVSFGYGQRLQRVLQRLGQQQTQIEQVHLLDPLENLSPLWQKVIRHFKFSEIAPFSPEAKPGSDLAVLQNALTQLANEEMPKDMKGSVHKKRLNGDGSVLVMKAMTKDVSARLIVQWLAKQAGSMSQHSVALLSGSDGVALDGALEAVDLPRLGFERTSPWRPVLQVLPIALDLLWEPLNPEILLQFLMLPLGPLPARICKPLATVVAEMPGIGGELWENKFKELLAKEKTREDYSELRFKQLCEELEYWFSGTRYAPEQGMSIAAAKQRCLKVANWLVQQQAQCQNEAMQNLFAVAYSQANELNLAFDNFLQEGVETIKPEQLHYLIEQLSGAGSAIVDKYAECVPGQPAWLAGTRQAEAFYQPVDCVIWWDLSGNDTLPAYPWSSHECQQLIEEGVLLPDLERQLQWQAQSWLKPVYAARERFILVLHDSDEAHHPLWDQINSCVENWREIRVEDCVLLSQSIEELDRVILPELSHHPLPSKRRWWQLEQTDYLKQREVESYSSLESLFYSPYQWVLRYKAKLQKGSLETVSDGNQLKGKLVHHLFELFFKQHVNVLTETDPDFNQVDNWFDQTMDSLLREEGAVLLMPGRMVEKELFVETALQSLHELIKQLRAADVVAVEMEAAQEALFFGGNLTGFIDMKVTNREGQEAVIDIKWRGTKYRIDSLCDNTHLQLVTYAYLRHKDRSSNGQWPAVAFFVIDKGLLITQDKHYFPAAFEVTANDEENLAEIWQRMKQTWEWRRQQLDRGWIEVTITGTQADEDSDPGEDALPIPESNDAFNDYSVLTGWEQ
jgi:hypothetical protein